jgi:hypothetical protein
MTERGSRRILAGYLTYYHHTGTHLALDNDTPLCRPVATSGTIVAIPEVGAPPSIRAPRRVVTLHRTVSQSRGVWAALINAFVGVARGLRNVSVERCSQNISPLPTSVLVVVL